MKILFIAPLPPPIHGQSLAAKILLDELENTNEVFVVNARESFTKNHFSSLIRIFEVIQLLCNIIETQKKADIIYLQISESLLGNIKDLIIYWICRKKLSTMYIHLHGGSLKRMLFDKNKWLLYLNKYFISQLAGVIVLGKSHVEIFSGLLDKNKILIVPNFSEDYLFVDNETINEKFLSLSPLKVVFMSNLIPGKGYLQLIEAYKALDNDLKIRIQLDFCGNFNSIEEETKFIKEIEEFQQVNYHGIVNGDNKKEILNNAHVFCLPTSYYEGQPISILEAYASGCYVITTSMGGIKDIFEDRINGYELTDNSVESIQSALKYIIKYCDNLHHIALKNNIYASTQYRTELYCNNISNILVLN